MLLYYVPRTRSSRPRWLLEELGVPYELARLDPSKGEHKTAEYKTKHPLQHVPALQTDEGPLFESAALCLYLADKYPEKKLIGPLGSYERGLAYQWCFFAMAEVEPLGVRAMVEKNRKDGPPNEEKLADYRVKLAQMLEPVEALLTTREFILERFSVADVVLGGVVWWAGRLGLLEGLPNTNAWIERLTARPAWKKASAD